MKVSKMAHDYALEMVEHNLKHGAHTLDPDFIAKQACDIAYAMKKELDKYEDDEDELSKDDVIKIIKEHELSKTKPL